MPSYHCRMANVDEDDEWLAVSNFDAESAAQEFAEHRDNQSAGELLQDCNDRQTVFVREAGSGKIHTFEISIDYSKVYYANEVEAV